MDDNLNEIKANLDKMAWYCVHAGNFKLAQNGNDIFRYIVDLVEFKNTAYKIHPALDTEIKTRLNK